MRHAERLIAPALPAFNLAATRPDVITGPGGASYGSAGVDQLRGHRLHRQRPDGQPRSTRPRITVSTQIIETPFSGGPEQGMPVASRPSIGDTPCRTRAGNAVADAELSSGD